MELSKSTNPSQPFQQKSIILMLILFLFRIGIDLVGIFQLKTPWTPYLYQVPTYLLSASIIWLERENLQKINVDGFALIIFTVFRTVLWATFEPNFYNTVAFVFYCIIAVSLIIRLNKSGYLKNLRPAAKQSKWLLYGVIVGIVIGSIPILLKQTYGETNFNLYGLIFAFWFHLSNTSIDEEPLFRSFIFGYLLSRDIKYRWAILIQAVIFGVAHVSYWTKPGTIVLIIIVSIIYGVLAWRSRSIAPSMLAHAWFNAFADML